MASYDKEEMELLESLGLPPMPPMDKEEEEFINSLLPTADKPMDKEQTMRLLDNLLGSNMPRPQAIYTPEEAARVVDDICPKLFNTWRRLRAIVFAHEETIRKRWSKRTTIKRKQLLQEVDPNLPKEHAPEIARLRDKTVTAILEQNRSDFVMPYLNLEDLSVNNGVQFLGLLHWRAYEFPSNFIWFDKELLHFGCRAGGIQRVHAMDCAMVTFGDEATYGKVLGYSDRLDNSDKNSPDSFQMEGVLKESICFGTGLMVLETQTRLMNFLIDVVSKILCDIDLSNPVPSAPLAGLAITDPNTKFPWKSSARTSALRPYNLPPVFSLDALAALLDSQYELAVQHLADLRTDPMYLAESIQSYYDHRIETILGKAPLGLIQKRTVLLVLSDAYLFLGHYHVAKEIVDEFRTIQAKFPNGVARARSLPPEYEDALRNLYPLLGLLESHITTIHRTTICSSPVISKAGLSVSCTDPNFARHEMQFKSRPEDELYSYMRLLLDPDQALLWELPRVFDQIDRITEQPAEHERLSPLLANLLSHWAIIHDCKSMLGLHRPAVDEVELLDKAVSKRLQKWAPLLFKGFLDSRGAEANIAGKAFPLSKFRYPKDTRNEEWARNCQQVDDAFAAFWKAADAHLVKQCGKELFALGTAVVAPFIVPPIDWEQLAKPKASRRRPNPSPTAVLPFGGAAQSPSPTEPVQALKEKPKTRGVPAAPTEKADHEQKPIEILPAAPTPVSAKVYKVFSTLFNAAKDEELSVQQSSVPWKDILTAFSQLAFALEKSRGSAWTFRHPDERRSVTVHEPHPEPTMRFWEARRFGRRLTRRFGWTLESFTLDTGATS
ncbi:hypothetical protein K438DRAFT_1969816 [Mycena galopus ATCC 62051]|nr:hypothetical protein K438DRAFT_1969816 [Mycena galopus ATCC 62051]